MPWWFFVAVVGGPLVLVGAVLTLVFSLIRRAIAQAAAALADEGVELDSGPLAVSTRYRNFRTQGFSASAAVNLGPGRLVLTKKRLHIIKRPQRYGIIERAWLPQFSVDVDGGRLRIRSEDPPEASGSVEYHAPVSDPEAWVKALRDAGAKPA
jgi:hypothetical protein